MSKWIVYSKDGLTERCSVRKLQYDAEFMGACSVTVSISSPTPILFSIGDFIEYRGERFELNYDPSVIKQSSYDTYGEGFTYDDVKFNSLSDELTRCEFLDYVKSDNLLHYSSLPNFSFFADNIYKLTERIKVNLDRVYTGDKAWTIVVHPEYINATNVNISVSSINCWEALALVKEYFDASFIIRGRTITVGTAGIAVGNVFGYGKGNGLVSIERNAEQDQAIVTRLRAYGSTRNMPAGYYHNYSENVPNNMAVQNLMLPSFPDTTLDPYIDSANVSELGVREGTLFFDGSGETEEIYPSMEGMTAEDLIAAGVETTATGDLDIVYSAEQIEDNGIFEPQEGEESVDIPTFTITLKDIGFDINDYLSASGNASISMKDGMCGGREFEIVSCEKDESSRYLLTCNRSEDSGLGLFFPYKDYQIQSGDKFVLLNIEMPDVYIKAASQKLLEAATAWLAKNDYVRYSYTPTIDNIWMQRQHDAAVEGGYASIHDTIKEGDLFLFEDADLDIDGSVIIDQLTIKEDSDDSFIPQYEITLRNDKAVGTIDRLQNQIDSIAAGGGQGGGYNAEQIQSLVKAYGSRYFLSKVGNDRSRGGIASDKYLEVGNYSEGLVGGSGARLYQDENKKTILEVDKIHGREELLVPTITFNNVEVISGDKANTFAYGTVKSVDVQRGIVYLDLLEDEYSTVQELDLLRGVFHNINGGNNTDTAEDSNGFLQYSGYFTSYFTPTQIITNEAGEMSFYYSVQDESTPHPCAGMKFFAYGNADPLKTDRHSITYENRDYKRRLVNITSWVISPDDHIAMQDGKLDGLVIGGFEMKGYGTFQTNSYFTGVQIQFTPDQLGDLKGEDAYSVSLSSYEGIIKVDANGEITSGMTSTFNVISGSMNVVSGDGNVVVTDFNLKTQIQAARGSTPLFYSTSPTEGAYVASISTVGCEAYILNGAVIITEIKDKNDCYVTIGVNCEGKYSVEQTYRITAVYDGQSSEFETIYSTLDNPTAPENKHPYEEEGEEKVWTHTVSEDNIWMAIATKKNEEWSDWQVTRIKGFDAFDYKVLPENTSIQRTMTGSLSPKTFRLTCYRVGAGERVPTDSTWYLERSLTGEEGSWIASSFADGSATLTGEYIDLTVDEDEYSFYRMKAVPKEYETVTAIAHAVKLDEGAPGQIARYRGVYKEVADEDAYVWNEQFRDIVVYGENAYQVKSKGAVITNIAPTNSEYWEQASKFSFVAMDTALIDRANIAGFTFYHSGQTDGDGNPLGVMKSQDGSLILDAENNAISVGDEGNIIKIDAANSKIALVNTNKVEVGKLGFSTTDNYGWFDLLADDYKMKLYGSSISFEKGGTRTVLLSGTGVLNIVSGTNEITISEDSVVVKSSNYTSTVSDSLISVQNTTTNKMSVLTPTGLTISDNEGNSAVYDINGGSGGGGEGSVVFMDTAPSVSEMDENVLYVIG